jgi:hypothetical protein
MANGLVLLPFYYYVSMYTTNTCSHARNAFVFRMFRLSRLKVTLTNSHVIYVRVSTLRCSICFLFYFHFSLFPTGGQRPRSDLRFSLGLSGRSRVMCCLIAPLSMSSFSSVRSRETTRKMGEQVAERISASTLSPFSFLSHKQH